jgi:hypothetical protein
MLSVVGAPASLMLWGAWGFCQLTGDIFFERLACFLNGSNGGKDAHLRR